MALRNKSLRFRPRLGGASSGVGEELVRAGSAGAGHLACVRLLPALGDTVVGGGVLVLRRGTSQASMSSSSSPSGTAWGSRELGRGMAVGLLAAWWVGCCSMLGVHQRREQTHGLRCSGCVPGRCASKVFFCCGSCQSRCAMERLLVLALVSWVSPSFSDGGAAGDGEGRRQRGTKAGCTKDPLDSIVIFLFAKVFCVKWCGQLSPLYPSRWFLYCVAMF